MRSLGVVYCADHPGAPLYPHTLSIDSVRPLRPDVSAGVAPGLQPGSEQAPVETPRATS